MVKLYFIAFTTKNSSVIGLLPCTKLRTCECNTGNIHGNLDWMDLPPFYIFSVIVHACRIQCSVFAFFSPYELIPCPRANFWKHISVVLSLKCRFHNSGTIWNIKVMSISFYWAVQFVRCWLKAGNGIIYPPHFIQDTVPRFKSFPMPCS